MCACAADGSQVATPSSLNTSNANFLALLKNEPARSAADLAAPQGSYVDVRDVAWAHAEALVHPSVAGRVTLSAGAFTWQDVGRSRRRACVLSGV